MKNKENMLQKKKENKNIYKKIAWLQACFLGDMGVIWCNSLGDSHFQTYVMNNVESVFIHCLHITLWVSHALASCTHHKQNFVKFDTCDCMLSLCGLPKLNVLICLMHFGEWGKKRLKNFSQNLNFFFWKV